MTHGFCVWLPTRAIKWAFVTCWRDSVGATAAISRGRFLFRVARLRDARCSYMRRFRFVDKDSARLQLGRFLIYTTRGY